mgnify:CR=1 FL=1
MAEKNKFNNLDDEDMFVTLDLDDGSSMECQILTTLRQMAAIISHFFL